jgi:hypothetical protein
MVDLIGEYGSGEYGSGPYGSAFPPYGLESVTALTPTLVRVRYTALFDSSFPALLSPGNYSIFPTLVVHAVILESAQTVLLITDPQSEIVYTLTISDARGYFGQPLDPALNSKNFLGVPTAPTFFAVATRKTRVRAVFSEPMLQNAALTDPLHYALTDLDGNPLPIVSVVAEQATNVRSTVLTVGQDLVDERHYKLTALTGIITVTLKPLTPDTSVFQWVENVLNVSIPVERFSGEVQNGLYGIHNGLVFFSPALVTSAANSIIEIDEVDVCTKAYDEYHFPQPIDPRVLFTHGAGLVPTPTVTTLNADALWAKFPRLVEATISLGNKLEDTVPPPDDTGCDVTMQEPWDPAFVSLLNNPYWKLFDNAGTPPLYFATASNLAPIPPGGTTYLILKMTMAGGSSMTADGTL